MTPKPMWTCPRCGRAFANANQWHSCATVPPEEHLEGCDEIVHALYRAFLDAVGELGPYELHSVKTRIGVLARMTFAELVPRRRWLRGHLILRHPVEHSPFVKVETFTPACHRCIFKLERLEDMDERFLALLREAYAVGEQR